ncbi:hypothetical protein ACWF0M_05335 [Kribbella sp. NPDC055110]
MNDAPRDQLHREVGQSNVAWSIRKLIELIDEAIDSAGDQLARSAGLWAESPGRADAPDRLAVRRRSGSLSARSLLEEPDRDNGVGPL